MPKRLPALFVVVALAASGCAPKPHSAPLTGNTDNPPPGLCFSDGWCWRNPVPQGAQLNGVSGTSTSNVWAVGQAGTVMSWNGSAWSIVDAGTSQDLNSVWAASTSDIWVVGDAGTVLHFVNGTWNDMTPTGVTQTLNFVWGSDSSHVWMTGAGGTLLFWDGSTLSNVSSQVLFTTYGGIWGSSGDDVWLVGGQGGVGAVINHYDGTSWERVNVPSDAQALNAVFGSGVHDVWAVGAGGTIINWNGTSWTDASITNGPDFSGVWAPSSDEVWAVGSDGAIFYQDNNVWRSVGENEASPFTAVWGASAADFWMTGGTTLLVHIGTGGQPGAGFSAANAALSGLWASPDATQVWFVGGVDPAIQWTANGWVPVELGGAAGITAINGTASNSLWGVGHNGIIAQWNGSQWTAETSKITGANLNSVSTGMNPWAVGDSGTLAYYLNVGNTTWMLGPAVTNNDLECVFNVDNIHLWAVGLNGTVLHNISGNWTLESAGSAIGDSDLFGVWGTADDQMWAAGAGGVFTWNGTSWTSAGAPPGQYSAVAGLSPTDVWAVGDNGLVTRWDGTGWSSPMQIGTSTNLLAVGESNNQAVWVSGADGTILEYTPPGFQ